MRWSAAGWHAAARFWRAPLPPRVPPWRGRDRARARLRSRWRRPASVPRASAHRARQRQPARPPPRRGHSSARCCRPSAPSGRCHRTPNRQTWRRAAFPRRPKPRAAAASGAPDGAPARHRPPPYRSRAAAGHHPRYRRCTTRPGSPKGAPAAWPWHAQSAARRRSAATCGWFRAPSAYDGRWPQLAPGRDAAPARSSSIPAKPRT